MTEVKRVQEDHPKACVKLWAMDEHRVGLKPILRRMWMPRTALVVALVWPRYESVQLSAFVCPETGETWMTDRFKVNIVNFDEILERFALEHQVEALNRVVLVVDRAGWHTSKKIVLPEGVDLVFLPPYSPELQPSERLWRLTDEPLVNRSFDTLDHLVASLRRGCRSLLDRAAEVAAHTLFSWWPRRKSWSVQ